MTDTRPAQGAQQAAPRIRPQHHRHRSVVMGLWTLTLILLLLSGCAGLAGKSRVEQFGRIAKAYEWALESSDYRGATKYLDASVARPPIDLERYANIKIAQYTITNAEISPDKRSIEQDVELQYFLLDQNILKTAVDRQVWRYSEAAKAWQLQSGLPSFPR